MRLSDLIEAAKRGSHETYATPERRLAAAWPPPNDDMEMEMDTWRAREVCEMDGRRQMAASCRIRI